MSVFVDLKQAIKEEYESIDLSDHQEEVETLLLADEKILYSYFKQNNNMIIFTNKRLLLLDLNNHKNIKIDYLYLTHLVNVSLNFHLEKGNYHELVLEFINYPIMKDNIAKMKHFSFTFDDKQTILELYQFLIELIDNNLQLLN